MNRMSCGVGGRQGDPASYPICRFSIRDQNRAERISISDLDLMLLLADELYLRRGSVGA
jgi:hypothetical protein